jgi:hypothetical protein
MRLARAELSGEQLSGVLDSYGLLPDELAGHGAVWDMIAGASQFFWLHAGRRNVGLVWLSDIVPGATASIHIMLSKPFRRFMRPESLSKTPVRDINTAGKMAVWGDLAEYCFESLGVRRITAPIPKSRKAAVRLVRRLGFQREGCVRSGASFCGRPEDVWLFGLTKEDYHGIRGSGS